MLHRLNGRMYIGCASALFMLGCAALAWRAARWRQFRQHERWTLRLFVAASGVWFFRVGLMAWLALYRGPVGFDAGTFQGPFLTLLAFGIAMVFQSYALCPHMTVRENMSFGLRNLKRSAAEIQSRVDVAAQLLRLDEHLERLPSQLSGGQRQRVAIGRAIVPEPKIFLFDEPLSNLDAELRVQMRRELGKLHQRLGSTMVYVTHDQTEAMTLADRIILLDKGRIVQFGTPLEIYNEPSNTFAAGFLGSPRINLVEARTASADGGTVRVTSSLGPALVLPRHRFGHAIPPATLTLGLRPEHLSLTPAPGQAEVRFTATAVEALGDSSCIYGMLGGREEVVLKMGGQIDLPAGQACTAYVAPEDILLFGPEGDRIVAAAR